MSTTTSTSVITPPPVPPTDQELEAAGLDVHAVPNPICESSANSQYQTNSKWNRQHYEGYQNAVNNAKSQGSNPPPTIEPPSLDGNYAAGKPYYRLEDIRALRIFCSQQPDARPVPYPPDTWNWSQVW